MNIIDFDYENKRKKQLVKLFINSSTHKKYVLGINKLTKSIQKHIIIDGIVDDFTRVQSSRKKDILKIQDIPVQNSIVLFTSSGSPLEVKQKLDELGYLNISYLDFYTYSGLELTPAPFMDDFKDDFLQNRLEYQWLYDKLEDLKSKEIFEKLINFKISFDYDFMDGFTNNHTQQYFDTQLIKHKKDIVFVDGGGYVGDTLPQIIKNFPDFKKIYLIEPNLLHINIAKRDFSHISNIEFINCGLGDKKSINTNIDISNLNNCDHNYQASNINTIDNLISTKVDFIKLDIEGAEQDAIDGAVDTIKNYQPILAICIYHKANDWYKIPQKILKINKNYKIYLRHYMEGIYETVLYFIPSSG
jgi:FkbM family methyltransferase